MKKNYEVVMSAPLSIGIEMRSTAKLNDYTRREVEAYIEELRMLDPEIKIIEVREVE